MLRCVASGGGFRRCFWASVEWGDVQRGGIFVLCWSEEVRRVVGWKPESRSHICSRNHNEERP